MRSATASLFLAGAIKAAVVFPLLHAVVPLYAASKDDPVLQKIMVDEFEVRATNGHDPLILDAQAWLGKDLEKLWLKAELEREAGHTEEAELQLLYSRALAPFWNLQLGMRKDFQPTPDRSWVVAGVQGLAPYNVEIDAALFIGESGRAALRLEAEYELMLTQYWVLSPELELNAAGYNESASGIGSGIAGIEAGLRLRYQVKREFAPYVGVNWQRAFGNSKNFIRAEGGDPIQAAWVLGLRAWF